MQAPWDFLLLVVVGTVVATLAQPTDMAPEAEAQAEANNLEIYDGLPDFFPGVPCPRNLRRVDLRKCMRSNFQKLIPVIKDGGKLRLPSLDPSYLERVVVDYKSLPLDFYAVLSNITVTGLSKMVVRDVRADLKNDSMDMEVDLGFPVSRYRAQFEFANGLFAQWTFKGRGPVDVTFYNISVTWKFSGRKAHNERYMNLYRAWPSFTVGGVNFWAAGFVDGYPAIDDLVVTVVNQLWAPLVELGKPSVKKTMSAHFLEWANGVFQSVPYDAFFPPPTPGEDGGDGGGALGRRRGHQSARFPGMTGARRSSEP